MVRDRSKTSGYARKEATREEVPTKEKGTLLTFSFKNLDERQPKANPESLTNWHDENLLASLVSRLKDLSQLGRSEATQQQQIKIYGDFPPKDKTNFFHPEHVEKNVSWGVIKSIKGQVGTVAGYIVEDTFHVVFLDKNHKFWISEKKHT
jgi:hypothetical protein